MNNPNKNDIDKLIKNISKNSNLSEDDLRRAQGGNLDSVMSKLNVEQTRKLQNLMKDEEGLKKLLNTPKAQNLLKKFLENK